MDGATTGEFPRGITVGASVGVTDRATVGEFAGMTALEGISVGCTAGRTVELPIGSGSCKFRVQVEHVVE